MDQHGLSSSGSSSPSTGTIHNELGVAGDLELGLDVDGGILYFVRPKEGFVVHLDVFRGGRVARRKPSLVVGAFASELWRAATNLATQLLQDGFALGFIGRRSD